MVIAASPLVTVIMQAKMPIAKIAWVPAKNRGKAAEILQSIEYPIGTMEYSPAFLQTFFNCSLPLP